MKKSHNYGELYKLFGYRKKLDRPLIFEALLYAIADMVIFDAFEYDSSSNACPQQSAPYAIANVKEAWKKLPDYLGLKLSYRKMWDIEEKLKQIDAARSALRKTPLFHFKKRLNKRKELNALKRETLPTADVFQYLEYVAMQYEATERADLYQEFKDYCLQRQSFT